MLSRVAEAVYWMSRYVERAENVARFVSVNLNLSLDFPQGSQAQWDPLVVTTGDSKAFQKRYDESSRENVIRFLTFDRENHNSILSSLTAARENARTIRECISSEMWEHLNQSYLSVRQASKSEVSPGDSHEFYKQIRFFGQQFSGMTDATMSHGEAWHFCRLARLLERADKTSRILDVKYYILLPTPEHIGSPLDDVQWSALLRSASALEMYRQRHGRITPLNVVEFLILDREFPRAVLYCLTKGYESLHAITGTAPGSFSNCPERSLGGLRAELAYSSSESIVERGLHEFVDNLQLRINDISEEIRKTFFAVEELALEASGTVPGEMH